MSSNHTPSAMRRKAGAGRPPPEIGQLTPARALRAAVAQAAQDVAALVAVAGSVEEARTTLSPIVEGLPDQPLLGLVEGPESRFGLVVLDVQAVAALIEMQTTGRVVPRAALARTPTRTDAIMCADFIDRVLELVEEQLGEAELPVATVFSGFRYALALAETRAIAMTLDDVPYRKLSLTVDFGHGAKSGEIAVILPFDPPGPGSRGGADRAGFSEALREQVLETQADLAATLARREMTLADVTRLTVGSVVALPRDVLTSIAIEDLAGHVVARGRLGQADGHRAVRITDEDERAMPRGAATGLTGATPPLQIAAPGIGEIGAFDGAGAVDASGGLPGLGDMGAVGTAPQDGGDAGLPDLGALGSFGATEEETADASG